MICPPLWADNTGALFELIGERLALMDKVAAWKFERSLAIEDRAREQVVLDQAALVAKRAGITGASSRAFFEIQIEAAKEIQRFWFARWRTEGTGPGEAPDLNEDIRPRLIELGDRIVKALAAEVPLDDSVALRQQFNRVVDVPGLSAETRARLFNAMLAINTFSSRLDQIMAVGAIRIGTTADYAPFSFRSTDGTLEGIDIALGRNLAAALDVEAVFVETSWPTLMEDLANDRFDIGMSGISRTPARQRLGFLSLPYHQGGKTPIARCENVRRFDSLAAIDQPDVRVIVNPGGTNHKFVKQHLKRANVIIHEDNRTIFDEIVSNHADVMITDAIEVRLKAGQNNALCATMPNETLTWQEKAYLMPRDEALREFVDTWLSLRIGDGTVERVFDRQLAD